MAISVLYLVASVNPAQGGIAEGVLRSSEELRKLGHRVEIASLDHREDPWVSACKIKTTGLGLGGSRYKLLRRFLPWLRYGYSPSFVPWLKTNAGNYDFVVVNGLWNYVALGSWRALRKSNVPYFVYTHGMLDPWFRNRYFTKHVAKQFLWFFSEGRLLSHARAVLFTSEEELRLAKDAFYPYRKINGIVAGYGTADVPIDMGDVAGVFFERYSLLAERPFVLFLGRLHPKKGCDLLIRAFHRVRDRFPFDIVFAGPDQIGWQSELVRLTKELGVADRVHWTGMLTGDLKWGALRACEAFILPSHQENFGMAVAEALACGKEVLITNKVNIWHEIERSDTGIVGEDTEDGIVSLLERFTSRNDNRVDRQNRARSVFLAEFAIGASTQRLVEIFRRYSVCR